jgi:hypothetical protein
VTKPLYEKRIQNFPPKHNFKSYLMIALILSLTRAYGVVLKIVKLFGEVLNSSLVVLIIGLKLVALLLMRTTPIEN